MRFYLPRWGAVALWSILLPLFHAGFPWVLSHLGAHLGWTEGIPSTWNRLGLVPVASGFGLIGWAMERHYDRHPAGWTFDGRRSSLLRPDALLTDGPYRFSRNPMYVGALLMWAGWSWFYGSAAVAAGFALLLLYLVFIKVPSEERQVASVFGDAYLAYTRRVPRWIGGRR